MLTITFVKGAPIDSFLDKWFPPINEYELPSEDVLTLNKVNWVVSRNKVVLLVHDMQNFWVNRFVCPEPIIQSIASLIRLCRSHNIPVIYTVAELSKSHGERGLALDLWGPGLSVAGGVTQYDLQIVKRLAPLPTDHVVVKSKYSAFFNTTFEETLRSLGRTQLILTGVYASHGCMVTALDAYMRNIEVFFVANATADLSRHDHDMGLRYVAEMSGTLTTTQHIFDQLESGFSVSAKRTAS